MLYGNGVNKQVLQNACIHNYPTIQLFIVQVIKNFHPLIVCLSYSGTLNIVSNVCADHDVEVQLWTDDLVKNIYFPVSV